MKNNLPTEAGQTEAHKDQRAAQIDAINQVFALFKLNYHNQFFRAFAQESDLSSIKRLWLQALQAYSAETILAAARAVIESSEYLPTLKTMLDQCLDEFGLADAHAAYVEACCAPSPKSHYNWSHAIVYAAGKEIGWHVLHATPEDNMYPIFKKVYERLREDLKQGKKFRLPEKLQLEEKPAQAASEATRRKYMDALSTMFD